MPNESSIRSSAHVAIRSSSAGDEAGGEHSPYYRRVLSAGYKGYIQAGVGGATLYALVGAAIGLATVPLVMAGLTVSFGTAFAMVPVMSLISSVIGFSTFGSIGSYAGVTAESRRIAERRDTLLDLYKALPNTPEYDAQAREIERQLHEEHQIKTPAVAFHWKTALTCALIGAVIGGGLAWALPSIASHSMLLGGPLESVGVIAEGGKVAAAAISSTSIAVSAVIGALAGSFIGLDREYVRRWLDMSEDLLNDPEHARDAIRVRQQQIERLENVTPRTPGITLNSGRGQPGEETPEPIRPSEVRTTPANKVTTVDLQRDLDAIRTAMSVPTL